MKKKNWIALLISCIVFSNNSLNVVMATSENGQLLEKTISTEIKVDGEVSTENSLNQSEVKEKNVQNEVISQNEGNNVVTQEKNLETTMPQESWNGAEGVFHEIKWSITKEGVCTLSGTGNQNDSYSIYPWNEYNDKITKVIIKSSIKNVPRGSFEECLNLSEVIIDEGVESINSNAFARCTRLLNFVIPNSIVDIGFNAFDRTPYEENEMKDTGVFVFRNKIIGSDLNRKNIVIPIGVTGIDSFTFNNAKLESVILPDTLTTIGSYAFENCIALKEICIPEKVGRINERAFSGCTNLINVTFLNKKYIYIYKDAFEKTPFLEKQMKDTGVFVVNNGIVSVDKTKSKIIIPTGVTEIGAFEFSDAKLESIVLPNTLKQIDDWAFKNCILLKEITIPNSVERIRSEAFLGCTNLATVNLPSSDIFFGNNVFEGTAFLENALKNTGVFIHNNRLIACDKNRIKIEIPVGVTYIPMNFFESAKFETITLPNGLTAIDSHAFFNCTTLKEIIIPSSVNEIGFSAFEGCTSLSTVVIDNNNIKIEPDAFKGTPYGNNAMKETGLMIHNGKVIQCDLKRKHFIVPEGVYEIGNGVFEGAEVESIILPNTLKEIGYMAFRNCTFLKEINIPNGVQHILGYAFEGCTNLSSVSVTGNLNSIGYNAFEGTSIMQKELNAKGFFVINNIVVKGEKTKTNVSIPNGVVSIGTCAFSESNLESVTLPDSLKKIESDAFSYCNNLKEITIPGKVSTIESRSFYGCNNLNSVILAEGVKKIEAYSFYGCAKLKSVSSPKSLSYVNHTAFGNTLFYQNQINETKRFVMNNILLDYSGSEKQIIVPNNIVAIGDYAFERNTKIEKIILPEGLCKIGVAAFSGCVNLKDINIPLNVVEIGSGAFHSTLWAKNKTDEQGLFIVNDMLLNFDGRVKAVTIPTTVVSIEYGAFTGCKELTNVDIPESVVSIKECAFYETGLKSIRIPSSVKVMEPYCCGYGSNPIGPDPIAIKDFVVYGIKDSAAEIYAQKNEFIFKELGGTEEVKPINPFEDVSDTDWFKDAVVYVNQKGLMSGNAGKFSPSDKMTRAMMVTTLYRLAGAPKVTQYTATKEFSDVVAGAWYEDAVNWAYNEKISTGYPDVMKFGVNDNVTREQLAAFFYRYAKMCNLDITKRADITTYIGYKQISSYAKEAMSWSVGVKIMSGIESVENGKPVYDLSPQGNATRAQLATMLMRFCQSFNLK